MGEVYDRKRGLEPYGSRKHFAEIKNHFGDCCCYCNDELRQGNEAQDHLIPTNRESLGLHAWGNIVPACRDCNAKKQGRDWRDYLADRAGAEFSARQGRISAFIKHYRYAPDLSDLRIVAADLYAEVGTIAMALLALKIERLKAVL
jgi:hypothetical protein